MATLCGLTRKKVLVVVQENPPELADALTLTRRVPGSMNIFLDVHPALIPRAELIGEFRKHNFLQAYSADRSVADGKKMAALGFERIR